MWILWETGHRQKTFGSILRVFFCVSSQQRAFTGDFNVCFTAPNWLQYLSINSYLAAKNVYSIMHHIYILHKFNYFWCQILYKLSKKPLFIRFSDPRAVQAQLACLGHAADSAVGRLEKESGLVPAAVARDFQRTGSKVAFPGLKKKPRDFDQRHLWSTWIHLLYFTIFVYDSFNFEFRLNIMVEHSTKVYKVTAPLRFCWLDGTAKSGISGPKIAYVKTHPLLCSEGTC